MSVPVIASLNGTTVGGWLDYAPAIEQTGADGLELNLYDLANEPGGNRCGSRAAGPGSGQVRCAGRPDSVGRQTIAVLLVGGQFRRQRLDALKVDALVLFNRFYQPDISVNELEVSRRVSLSIRPSCCCARWLAILSGRVRASLGETGGVHTIEDAVKAIMAGAHGVAVVVACSIAAPTTFGQVRDNLAAGWRSTSTTPCGRCRAA